MLRLYTNNESKISTMGGPSGIRKTGLAPDDASLDTNPLMDLFRHRS